MPRFVILRHESRDRPVHWDFMLEAVGGLRTWSLVEEPAAERAIEATELPLHRALYLDYEGPLSQDRGEVRRWDAGTYELATDAPREVVVRLAGERLQGVARLTTTADEAQRWSFWVTDA
jgi:DNA polymerase ligase (LigD)-like protein